MVNRMKRFAWLGALLLLFLSGCAKEANGPVQVSETVGDFKFTLTSLQSVYDAASLDPESPLELEVRVDYLGQEEFVHIWSGAFLGDTRLYFAGEATSILAGPNKDGKQIPYDTDLVEYKHSLEPDRPLVELHDGSLEYEHLGELPAGAYTAKAYISFSLEDNEGEIPKDSEEIEATLELPFEIR